MESGYVLNGTPATAHCIVLLQGCLCSSLQKYVKETELGQTKGLPSTTVLFLVKLINMDVHKDSKTQHEPALIVSSSFSQQVKEV